MKYANNKLQVLLMSMSLVFLPVNMTQAETAYPASALDPDFHQHNMVQNEANWQRLDMSEGQTRSKLRHTVVNYLLGRATDQYLDLGDNDEVAKKSSKRLKLRLRRHRMVLMYQYRF